MNATPADRPARPTRALRYVFVHAHPDDETLATGVALAHLSAAGHDVHVLTCTLGEEGEVIPAELAHLGADADDTLGPYRRGELRAAMAALGVREHVLGESDDHPVDARFAQYRGSAYRDSGMADTAANAAPGSWLAADEATGVEAIRAQLEALAPDVVVTYDEHGGYLHPDHVTTHRRTRLAVAALPADTRPTLYVVLVPADVAAARRTAVRDLVTARSGAGERAGAADASPGPGALPPRLVVLGDADPYPPSVVDPARVTHEIVGSPGELAARDEALRAHRTQVTVHDGFYTLSNDIAALLPDSEGFAQIDPETGALLPGSGAATDGAAARVRGLPGAADDAGAADGGGPSREDGGGPSRERDGGVG